VAGDLEEPKSPQKKVSPRPLTVPPTLLATADEVIE
jgi:hypothetical protein